VPIAPLPVPIALPVPIVFPSAAAPLPLPITVPSPIGAPPTKAPLPGADPVEILINCGGTWLLYILYSMEASFLTALSSYPSLATLYPSGPSFVETTLTGRNRTWLSDQYYSGGDPYVADSSTVISNTDIPTIYRSQRYGALQYEIPAPSATYAIKIHFAELYVPWHRLCTFTAL
jgi:Malectin domain